MAKGLSDRTLARNHGLPVPIEPGVPVLQKANSILGVVLKPRPRRAVESLLQGPHAGPLRALGFSVSPILYPPWVISGRS